MDETTAPNEPRDPGSLHIPVMLERCVELLLPALEGHDAVLVDATLGLGGHTAALLAAAPRLTVVGLDRDQQALALAVRRLGPLAERLRPVHTVYDRLRASLDELGIDRVDGVLFDLGVSSMQLDDDSRGFSYARDTALDMRMDQSSGLTAREILASYSAAELARIFARFGEERLAGRYADAIVRERERAPIESSARLVQLLSDATPAALRDKGHPAKRVFQALRIEVNRELAALADALPQAIDALRPGGRIVAMSYQSLEDRLVKRALAEGSRSSAPAGLPLELPEHRPRLRLLTRGAERASAQEAERNPRAIPVRLRAAEKLHAERDTSGSTSRKRRAGKERAAA